MLAGYLVLDILLWPYLGVDYYCCCPFVRDTRSADRRDMFMLVAGGRAVGTTEATTAVVVKRLS